MVLTLKVLHGMGLCNQKHHISPITSANRIDLAQKAYYDSCELRLILDGSQKAGLLCNGAHLITPIRLIPSVNFPEVLQDLAVLRPGIGRPP